MKVEITEFEKRLSFELESITQLCGQNIQKKTYIFESLKKYFSTFKYSEQNNKWRDNVIIDDVLVGRKYFSVISIKSSSDLIQMIKLSKQSLMTEYIKSLMQEFDWQLYLRDIEIKVDEMIHKLNDSVEKLGGIELTYTTSDVWDMVQQSNISGVDSTDLEDSDNTELIRILWNLIEKIQEISPRRMLVLCENIDHMIDRTEYRKIIKAAQNIAVKSNIYFIFSSSLDGYVLCDSEICSGISIFGDVDFQMPDFDHLCEFVRHTYPYQKEFSKDRICELICGVVQRIGRSNYLCDIEENVLCKMINESIMIHDSISDIKDIEITFLKS